MRARSGAWRVLVGGRARRLPLFSALAGGAALTFDIPPWSLNRSENAVRIYSYDAASGNALPREVTPPSLATVATPSGAGRAAPSGLRP